MKKEWNKNALIILFRAYADKGQAELMSAYMKIEPLMTEVTRFLETERT